MLDVTHTECPLQFVIVKQICKIAYGETSFLILAHTSFKHFMLLIESFPFVVVVWPMLFSLIFADV